MENIKKVSKEISSFEEKRRGGRRISSQEKDKQDKKEHTVNSSHSGFNKGIKPKEISTEIRTNKVNGKAKNTFKCSDCNKNEQKQHSFICFSCKCEKCEECAMRDCISSKQSVKGPSFFCKDCLKSPGKLRYNQSKYQYFLHI
jgi:hypothetical protein